MSTSVKNSKLRIVIDTNVFVSALVFGGKPRSIANLIAEKEVIAVISEEAMTELRRKIFTKFPDFTEDVIQFEYLLRRYARWVSLGAQTVQICRDPDDDKFIETAMLGNCHYIISGDNDLLALKSYKHLKILTPTNFLKLLS